MHKKIGALLVLVSLLLTGCWDYVEIEQRAHIGTVGIDRYIPSEQDNNKNMNIDTMEAKENNETDRYIFTFAFPNDMKEEGEAITISSVGYNLYGVSRIMANRTNKEIFLGHLRSVIIGADIAKNPEAFRGILDGIENNELLSRRVVLTMTDDSAADIININPSMQPRIGQFIGELFRRRDKTPRAPSGDIGGILKDLHECGNTVIPRIAAGQTDVKVAGAGVISNYQFSGWLGELDTAHLMVLKGEANILGGTSIKYKGRVIPIEVRPKKPKLKLIQDNNNIKILISIDAEADIKQTYFEFEEDKLESEFIRNIENLFNKEMVENLEVTIDKIQKEFRTDILGIDRYLRQSHHDLWKEVENDWTEIFPNIDINVNMDVKIRRIGLVK